MSYFSCFFNGVTETLGYFLFLISDEFCQRRPCRTGRKAILCQPKGQPQPKGHQRPVQHRPAAGKADAHRCQPPRRRAQHRPCR